MASPIRGAGGPIHQPDSPRKKEESKEKSKAHEPAMDAMQKLPARGPAGKRLPSKKVKELAGFKKEKTDFEAMEKAAATREDKVGQEEPLAGFDKPDPHVQAIKDALARRKSTGTIRKDFAEEKAVKQEEKTPSKMKKALDTTDIEMKPHKKRPLNVDPRMEKPQMLKDEYIPVDAPKNLKDWEQTEDRRKNLDKHSPFTPTNRIPGEKKTGTKRMEEFSKQEAIDTRLKQETDKYWKDRKGNPNEKELSNPKETEQYWKDKEEKKNPKKT